MPKSQCYRIPKPVGSRASLSRIQRAHFNDMVRCPTCLERLSLRDYIHEHALERHGWDPLRVCIYCSGGECWSKRKRNFKHILPCLRQFLKGRVPSAIVEPLPKVLQPCEECQKFRPRPRDMCGRKKDSTSELVGLYESCYERPEAYGKSAITFTEESGLGRDIYAIVKRYLRGDLEWYHLMVHHKNFYNFVKAFKKVQNQMFLLPFWCLCDGLTQKRKTHRHMIMAIEPETDFKSIWEKKVKYKLEEGGRSKKSIRIETAFHLIRTIQYVSQRKASCDGEQINDLVEEDLFKNSHFYINRPLHEHAIACMSTMFEGGLESLIYEQNKNKDVVGWLKHMLETRSASHHLQYAVPIGRTGFKFLNCVLHLSPEFEPSEERTHLWLHWMGKKKLYFKTDPNLMNLSREEWYAYQAVKGNTLTSISEELYVFIRHQQNTMKQIKMALAEKEEMDQRIRDDLCRVFEARITALEAEIADQMQKIQTVTTENANLKQKMLTVIAENANLGQENADLKQKIQTVTAENANLGQENADQKQKMQTLEGVESENTALKQKLECMKRVMLKLSWVQNESNLNSFITNMDCNLNWYLTNRGSMEEMRQIFGQIKS